MARPNRIALVIGNSAYTVGPLPNPVRDAALITHQLEPLGYRIFGGASSEAHPTKSTDGADPPSAKIFDLIGKFLEAIEPGSDVLIYYAGHALQVGDQNYLMPIDTGLEASKPDLGLIKIKEFIQRAAARAGGAGTVVALLDACRNNPLDDHQMRVILGRFADARPVEFGQEGASPVARGGLSTMKMDRNADQARTFIGFATAPGDVAYDGKRGNINSPFAEALGRHLTTRGLEIEELYNRVARDVLEQVEGEIRRFQDPWSETNLNRRYFIHPSSGWPVVVLGLLGLIAGIFTSAAVFDDHGLADPTGRPWVWAMGLLFGCVAAFGTWKWGSGRPFDLFLTLVGPGIGFALALSIMKIIPLTKSWNVSTVASPGADVAGQVYVTVTLIGGALYLLGIALLWRDSPPAWPRSGLQWLNRILTWALPFIVVGGLLLVKDYIIRTNPMLTALALFTVLGGVIYAMSVALSCRSQRGLFAQFGPITGAISVGLLMTVLFAIYASVSNRLGMNQAESLPMLVGFGAFWHLLLGAQLGYCFAYYVPDHKPWAPQS